MTGHRLLLSGNTSKGILTHKESNLYNMILYVEVFVILRLTSHLTKVRKL